MEIFDPYHDEEARGVLFQVVVQGRACQGYISCALLTQLNAAATDSEDWVVLYLRHRTLIDAIVARRAADVDWDTVMVGQDDLRPGT